MHEILHIIGLCPDTVVHLDLIDLLAIYYTELSFILDKTKLIINKIIMKKTLLILFAAVALISCNSVEPKAEPKNDSDSVTVVIDTMQPCCVIDTMSIDSVK